MTAAKRKSARRPERRVRIATAPLSDAEAQRLRNLEHLMGVMLCALTRIADRAHETHQDVGVGERVTGDIARGGLLTVKGIAKAALEEAFSATEQQEA